MWFQVNSFHYATKTDSQSCARFRIQRLDPIPADAVPVGIGRIDSLVFQQLSFANNKLMAVRKQIALRLCRHYLARLGIGAVPEIQKVCGALEQTRCIECDIDIRGHRGFELGPVLETGLSCDNRQRMLALQLVAAVVDIAGSFVRETWQDAETIRRL